jgi:hypothetical protein
MRFAEALEEMIATAAEARDLGILCDGRSEFAVRPSTLVSAHGSPNTELSQPGDRLIMSMLLMTGLPPMAVCHWLTVCVAGQTTGLLLTV